MFDSVVTAALENLGRAVVRCPDGQEDPVQPGPVEAGRGGAVVLVGGFATTDPVLQPMNHWLTRRGGVVTAVTQGAGLGCAGSSVAALRAHTVATAEHAQAPVWLIGHSRGGHFARAVAGAVPGHVAGLITLGTPFDLYGLGLPTLAAAAMVTPAGTVGVPGVATLWCLTGSCCRDFRATLPISAGRPAVHQHLQPGRQDRPRVREHRLHGPQRRGERRAPEPADQRIRPSRRGRGPGRQHDQPRRRAGFVAERLTSTFRRHPLIEDGRGGIWLSHAHEPWRPPPGEHS